MPVYGFDSQADFNRAVKSIKASENARMDVTPQRGRYPNAGASGGGGSAVGRATSAITPADDSLVGTAFTFRRFIVDDGATSPKKLKEDDKDSDGVNRYKHLSAGVDSLVFVTKINGEWTLISAEDVCPT